MNKNIENFMELDIRVGKILSAEEFPEIKKPSYILNIDFGEEIGIKKTLDWLSLGYDNYSYNELFKDKNVSIISSVDGSGSNAKASFDLLSVQLKNYGLKVYDDFYLFTDLETVDEMIEQGKNKEEFHNYLNLFLAI